jgi:hypothetical protein
MKITELDAALVLSEEVVVAPVVPAKKSRKAIDWLAVILEGNKLSLGRVSFWIAFLIMNYMWIAEKEVQDSTLTVLLVLLSYNLGKKVTDVMGLHYGTKNPPKDTLDEK